MNTKEQHETAADAPEAPHGLIEQPITPGSWHFDEETLVVTAGKSPGSPYVADCRFGTLVHRAPNARLIAKAPQYKASADKLAEALRLSEHNLARWEQAALRNAEQADALGNAMKDMMHDLDIFYAKYREPGNKYIANAKAALEQWESEGQVT